MKTRIHTKFHRAAPAAIAVHEAHEQVHSHEHFAKTGKMDEHYREQALKLNEFVHSLRMKALHKIVKAEHSTRPAVAVSDRPLQALSMPAIPVPVCITSPAPVTPSN